MASSGSHLHVLMCTGMGIDCKESYTVNCFGPPKNLECYHRKVEELQEIGLQATLYVPEKPAEEHRLVSLSQKL